MLRNWSLDLKDGVKTFYDQVALDAKLYISAYDLLKSSGQHIVVYRGNQYLVSNTVNPSSDAKNDLDNYARFQSANSSPIFRRDARCAAQMLHGRMQHIDLGQLVFVRGESQAIRLSPRRRCLGNSKQARNSATV